MIFDIKASEDMKRGCFLRFLEDPDNETVIASPYILSTEPQGHPSAILTNDVMKGDAVEYSGNIHIIYCEHDWVASNTVYTSDPPQWDEICRKCGQVRRVVAQPSVNEYDELMRKFHGA